MRSLKAAREEKNRVAARFGGAREKGLDLRPLKEEMTRVSRAYDAVEERLKRVQDEINLRQGEEDEREGPAPPPPQMSQCLFETESATPTGTQTSQPVRVRGVEETDLAAVSDFVAAHPHSGSWHDRRWSLILRDAMGAEDVTRLAVRSGEGPASGKLVGVLPLYRIRSRMFGDFLVSVPFLNGGGPIATGPGAERALLDASVALREELGADFVELRAFGPRQGWRERTDKVSMILALPTSFETFEEDLGAKVRAQARRGQKEGISVTFGRSPRDLAAFYRVFAHNMRDLGTPVYGIEFFQAILDSWGEQATIAVARLGKQPVGGALLLRYRETMEVPWASSLRAFHSAGANMHLYREVLRHAIEGGCAWFDFGRSTEGGGTFRFKSQWGAQPVRQHWLYSLPSGHDLPGLRPDNPRFRLAIETWKRLPLPITKLLGPRIVRKIP